MNYGGFVHEEEHSNHNCFFAVGEWGCCARSAVTDVVADMKLDAVVDKRDGGMICVNPSIGITGSVKSRLGI